jgi:hypothetical protein
MSVAQAKFASAAINSTGVDRRAGIMRGVILIEKGPAKFWAGSGKDRYRLVIGDTFLDKLAKLKAITVRADPPPEEIHGGALAVQGEAINIRREGDAVRGDIEFLNPQDAATAKLMDIGEKKPHLAAMSLDFTYRVMPGQTGPDREVEPVEVRFAEFVAKGAAARALFGAQVDTRTEDMNYDFLRSLCAKFGVQFPGTDAEVTPEIATKAQTDINAKFAAQETEAGELRAKLAAAEAHKPAAQQPIDVAQLTEKITEAVTAKLKAQGLVQVGAKAAPADPPAEPVKNPNTDAVAKLASKLGRKPEELTAQLAALPADAQEMCFKHGIDPVPYATNIAKFKAAKE